MSCGMAKKKRSLHTLSLVPSQNAGALSFEGRNVKEFEYIYIYIYYLYIWLHWVSTAVRGLSLVAESRVSSLVAAA